MRGGRIVVPIGCLDEISNRLYVIKPKRVEGSSWVTIERKEVKDLLKSLKTYELTNIMNPSVVISDCQWVQAKM